MMPPLTVIDVQQETQEITGYKNVPVSLINDHVVRLSIMTDQGKNTSSVEFSENTTIHLDKQGAKLSIGMDVEVWGNWKPFSLTVNAEAISEVIQKS
jgi:hypothetical protein